MQTEDHRKESAKNGDKPVARRFHGPQEREGVDVSGARAFQFTVQGCVGTVITRRSKEGIRRVIEHKWGICELKAV
jgi:hypothetical protein